MKVIMEKKKLDFLWDYHKIEDNNWDKLANAVLADIFGSEILTPINDDSWRCKVILFGFCFYRLFRLLK